MTCQFEIKNELVQILPYFFNCSFWFRPFVWISFYLLKKIQCKYSVMIIEGRGGQTATILNSGIQNLLTSQSQKLFWLLNHIKYVKAIFIYFIVYFNRYCTIIMNNKKWFCMKKCYTTAKIKKMKMRYLIVLYNRLAKKYWHITSQKEEKRLFPFAPVLWIINQ